jgi:uncharacterized protein YkwD
MGSGSRSVRGRTASLVGVERPFVPRRPASILAVWLLLAACGAAAPAEPPPDGVAAQLLAQVNAVRVEGRVCGARGAFPPTHRLTLEARLTAAAQDHADDMHARGTMSHTGGDGSDPGQRIARTGYAAAGWGENVAAGYPSVEAVMAGWLGSDGHCANLMQPGFTEFGAGESGLYWAQVFARPR